MVGYKFSLLLITLVFLSCDRTDSKKMSKNFKLNAEEITRVIPQMGGCFATDMITVDGKQVGYMYREGPDNKFDSGWRMLSGSETQDYMDNPSNTEIYDVNTIANYDPAIIPYLGYPIGSQLERVVQSDKFELVQN